MHILKTVVSKWPCPPPKKGHLVFLCNTLLYFKIIILTSFTSGKNNKKKQIISINLQIVLHLKCCILHCDMLHCRKYKHFFFFRKNLFSIDFCSILLTKNFDSIDMFSKMYYNMKNYV